MIYSKTLIQVSSPLKQVLTLLIAHRGIEARRLCQWQLQLDAFLIIKKPDKRFECRETLYARPPDLKQHLDLRK